MSELSQELQSVLTAWKAFRGKSRLEKREGKGRGGEGKERDYKLGVL